MAAKTAKIKRDSIARSRGISPTFAKTERDYLDPARINTDAGWYVVADDKTPRGLPRSYGPFKEHDAAIAFAKGLDAKTGGEATVTSRGITPPKRPTLTPEDVARLSADYRAKQAAALELRKAEREAMGKRTSFPWSRA
jgi:hypothetical protein